MSKPLVIRADDDLRLGEPDVFGNYWFGRRTRAPAILHSSIDGRYLILLSDDYGFARTTTPTGVQVVKVSDVDDALHMLNLWRSSRGKR